MHIDKKELISSIGCKDVRGFLKRHQNTFFTLRSLEDSLCGNYPYYKKSLHLSKNKARQLIRELKTRGFIKKCKNGGKGCEDTWRTTVKGNAFCIAKFLKPLGKKEAMILLDSLLERVQKVNCSESFLYFVNYVGLFGSFAAGVEQVNDIDLIVELKPKFPYDLDKIQKLHEEMEEKEGKTLTMSWIDRTFAPEDKVRKFLKNKNPYISIMAPSEVQCLSLKKESVITLFSQITSNRP